MNTKRFARLVAGTTLMALLGAACAQGGGETEVSVAPQSQAGHASAPEVQAQADPGNPVDLLRVAAGHLPGLAATLAGSFSQQFPDKYPGSVEDGAAKLRQTLTAGLQEHEYLAGIAVAMAVVTKSPTSPEFEAAAAALDKNSVALSEAVTSVYGPEAGTRFLDLWRTHIGFFVDYTVGKLTNDAAKADAARAGLDSYRADFGAFIESAGAPGLTKEAVAEALVPHVDSTFAAIDAVVAGDGTGIEKLRVAAGHMPMLAATLAGSIAQQFPDKYTGDPNSGASTLMATLTAGLQEHEYLAGITVVMGVLTKSITSPEFEAAAAALDKNSVALSEAVTSVYNADAGARFLDLWRTHIGFFVDYTLGKLTNDAAKAQAARAGLDSYRADFGAFVESAGAPGLTKDAVAQALIPHVDSTFAAIDSVVAVLGAPAAAPQAQESLPRTS
ncbi:MAG: hypothetical protein ACRDY7_12880 [Acidimicrobiia bacterium]